MPAVGRARRNRWSTEPAEPAAFTASFDHFYTRTARLYRAGVRLAPFWRRWLRQALPHLRGQRILEVSFGTGWLLTQYPQQYELHGVDLNAAMVRLAERAVRRAGASARLCRADVAALPYRTGQFDTIVNTMAFTGYPTADTVLAELRRVLRSNGRIVMVDVGFPPDANRVGTALARSWQRAGDLLRDMPALLDRFGFDVSHQVIGGRGSIHLYVADRREGPPGDPGTNRTQGVV